MRSAAGSIALLALLTSRAHTQSSGSDVNVASIPPCARACLSNSTQFASECPQIDVKCLCNSSAYVSALSCCLATTCNNAEQQTAIQFNIQECAAVNSTAPNFVGCSPFGTTALRSSSAASTATSSTSTSTSASSTEIVTQATYTNAQITTVSYTGSAIFTGNCSVPFFAQATNTAGGQYQFPEAGCDWNRPNCCPFNPQDRVALNKCPPDFTTIAGGCCPTSYSIYSKAIGTETPCYSAARTAIIPARTLTGQITLITDTIFTRKYVLATTSSDTSLSPGANAGIAINAVLFIVVVVGLVWWIRRRNRKRQTEDDRAETANKYPDIEPDIQNRKAEQPRSASPKELASPELDSTPVTLTGTPFPEQLKGRPESAKPIMPQEMMGDTHIHEHHPAMSNSSRSDISAASPRSPPQSPLVRPSTISPVLSPATPARTDSPGNLVLTPLTGSPATGPRFKEGPM